IKPLHDAVPAICTDWEPNPDLTGWEEIEMSGAALMRKTFEPLREAVPGLLPEGLTVVAARPKFGKSILCLGIAGACALGGAVLGRLRVPAGDVLYVSREDGPRRTAKRLQLLFGQSGPLPESLTVR